MKEEFKALREEMAVCDLHVGRIQISLEELQSTLPLSIDKYKKLTHKQLAFLDLLTGRFARLQDTIGVKIFRYAVRIFKPKYDEQMSVIDVLNLMEKVGYIESVEFWREMRDMRNHITHEYPDNIEVMVQNINNVAVKAKVLCKFWKQLSKKLKSELKKVE